MLSDSFAIQCYVPRRDLHSFPTRRSSDLLVHLPPPAGGAEHLPTPQRQQLDGGGDQQREERDAQRGHQEGVDQPGVLGDRSEDRKSTRLNSSHPSISYAVFCLKKKKINKT